MSVWFVVAGLCCQKCMFGDDVVIDLMTLKIMTGKKGNRLVMCLHSWQHTNVLKACIIER